MTTPNARVNDAENVLTLNKWPNADDVVRMFYDDGHFDAPNNLQIRSYGEIQKQTAAELMMMMMILTMMMMGT